MRRGARRRQATAAPVAPRRCPRLCRGDALGLVADVASVEKHPAAEGRILGLAAGAAHRAKGHRRKRVVQAVLFTAGALMDEDPEP